jgi:hypothetical protein
LYSGLKTSYVYLLSKLDNHHYFTVRAVNAQEYGKLSDPVLFRSDKRKTYDWDENEE